MRHKLKPLYGRRVKVKATCRKIDRSIKGKSHMLFGNVVDAHTNRRITDHVWMFDGRWLDGVNQNDRVVFDVWVTKYLKGYFGTDKELLERNPLQVDFCLVEPKNLSVINRGRREN